LLVDPKKEGIELKYDRCIERAIANGASIAELKQERLDFEEMNRALNSGDDIEYKVIAPPNNYLGSIIILLILECICFCCIKCCFRCFTRKEDALRAQVSVHDKADKSKPFKEYHIITK